MVPLNVLLSHALLDLTRACERAGAEEVVLWSNLLRAVGDDGIDRKALPSPGSPCRYPFANSSIVGEEPFQAGAVSVDPALPECAPSARRRGFRTADRGRRALADRVA